MQLLRQQAAEQYSSFRLPYQLEQLFLAADIADLKQFSGPDYPTVLGEGTNTIFLATQHKPVLRYLAKGISQHADTDHVLLHVEAGHNWHQLVSWTIEQQLWGLENLALIPGSMGAAPVQNIGAYGVELSDRCSYVDFYDWQRREVVRIPASECQFAYRDSIFKQQLQGRGVIVAVGLTLSRQPMPVLDYPGLKELPKTASLQQIFDTVIQIRQSKLPDYRQLPNCGSFFKNPVITECQFQLIRHDYPTLPGYPQAEGVKVPAAWLIEQAGFKGVVVDNVGCYQKQPLVIVNYGLVDSAPLLALIATIRSTVLQRFAIELEPEVRLLNGAGQHHVPA